ncbi:MAG: type II toxin-antitoxin system VapC family toxin [Bacteroidia bacterium]|nr:type II toxin-antitoxin system VapC family toxin [Bacteroidia bacterium]
MVLCDTNILIHAFNGNADTLDELRKISSGAILLSTITVMELYQGMGNKEELTRMKARLKGFNVIEIDNEISRIALRLIEKFSLSHGLQIPDAIIAATSLAYEIPLFTYNLKDFRYVPSLRLYLS